MKPAEKLKRIKLISEQIFIQENSRERFNHIPRVALAEACITNAYNFVNVFEKFEVQFLKDNSEVVDE